MDRSILWSEMDRFLDGSSFFSSFLIILPSSLHPHAGKAFVPLFRLDQRLNACRQAGRLKGRQERRKRLMEPSIDLSIDRPTIGMNE
mmetsp:Transcript_50743/g.99788  ORF Transcript_50743/g.99788 Transcript_50743/m.99788 type:complete len:87 (+) Transcript_50743:509-769(+)